MAHRHDDRHIPTVKYAPARGLLARVGKFLLILILSPPKDGSFIEWFQVLNRKSKESHIHNPNPV